MSAHADASVRSSAAGPLAERLASAGLDWIVPQWHAPTSVRGFVTTRNGGASSGAHASLDLGPSDTSTLDAVERAAVAENRRRVQAFLPSRATWLRQVHGSGVLVVNGLHGPGGDAPRADAAVTRAPYVVLAVRVADCLPVLFCAGDGAVIGIAHAGWRGLAGGVLENTVEAMACDPATIVAWLGPAIGSAAFEVGHDVRDAFAASDPASGNAFVPGKPGKWQADLERLARRRLVRAGLTTIEGGGMCTASDPARYFSFRRDGITGRMGAFIWRVDA